ncbi:MAG: MOSC domain-containing protein YiiM [Verrucomicrobiales bacterium]|jgi:MOSC domain-containing protein YiiM
MMRVAQIYISPGHNFFGNHGKPADDHKVDIVEEVECVTGKGLRGDRFFDYKDDYKGQVTFFSREVYDSLCRHFDVWDKPAHVLRRNVLIEGVDLNDWIGEEFEIQGIRFAGTQEAAPCYWMNQAFAPGAEEFLKGQGGLRAHILSDGILHCDPVAEAVTAGGSV